MEIDTLKRKYFIDILLEDERRSNKIKEKGKNQKEKHDIQIFLFFKGKEGNRETGCLGLAEGKSPMTGLVRISFMVLKPFF